MISESNRQTALNFAPNAANSNESKRLEMNRITGGTPPMLYSGSMNRLLVIAIVVCVILFVVAVLIAPTIDLEPSALRAQQWLSLITAMFSLAALFEICLYIMAGSLIIERASCACNPAEPGASSDLCCMRC